MAKQKEWIDDNRGFFLIMLVGVLLFIVGAIVGHFITQDNTYTKVSECHNLMLELEIKDYCRLRHSGLTYDGFLDWCKWMEDIKYNKTDYYAKKPDCKFPR